MENLDGVKRSVLGNMIIRQTMGGLRKEDKIKDKDDLIERIKEEYDRQNSEMTHKLDLTMLDVSKVEDMSFLFSVYYGYVLLEYIDVSNWDVRNVKDMSSMFCGCSSLKSVDVSGWNTDHVENMEYMFYMCNSLEPVDVSKWDVGNVEYSVHMFDGCRFDYKKEGNKLVRI